MHWAYSPAPEAHTGQAQRHLTAVVHQQQHRRYLLSPYGKYQLTAVPEEMPCDGHSTPSTRRCQQSDLNSLAGHDRATLLQVP